ncbi:hypothetical protein CABS03_01043 [Colletotrichum abscissum]
MPTTILFSGAKRQRRNQSTVIDSVREMDMFSFIIKTATHSWTSLTRVRGSNQASGSPECEKAANPLKAFRHCHAAAQQSQSHAAPDPHFENHVAGIFEETELSSLDFECWWRAADQV